MRLLPFLTAVLLFIGWAKAQDDIVKTKLMPVGMAGSIRGLYFRNEGKTAELHASMTGFGEGIDYTGSALLALYSSEAALAQPKPGSQPPKPLTTVTLPKGADRVLLVIAPPPHKGAAPAIRAYGVATSDLRVGDYRLFNFAQENVVVLLGGQRAFLKPGGITTLRDAGWSREVLDLPVKLGSRDENGSTRLLYSTVWGHQPGQRNFILILAGATAAHPVDVRRFYDVPEENPGSSGPVGR